MASAYQVISNILKLFYFWVESLVLSVVPKKYRYKDIAGQTVLITGGGSGIGRLLAIKFAEHKARVVIWDLNMGSAQETVKIVTESGGVAFAFSCDVSRPECVYEAARKVKEEVGKVDILVNNAGIVTGKRFLDCPDKMIQKTFEVNAMAHFWTCKAFLPDMMSENHGHIVSIASMAGLSGVVKLTDYCASKFAAVGFEESLRLELHSEGYTGIHSTVVCPYFINTGMFDGASPGIFPMMTPEYVASEIVASVLVNQEVVLLPKLFNLFMVLRGTFPSKCTREVLSKTNISTCMTAFEGRRRMSQRRSNKDDHIPNHDDDDKIKCL